MDRPDAGGTRTEGGQGLPVLVCLGTVALDTVHTPAGSARDVPGGSAPYFAAAARRWGRVRLVGVAGDDLPRGALAPLVTAGVSVGGIRRVEGRTFRWHARYDAAGERTTLRAERGPAVRTAPVLGTGERDAAALFLGSTDPRVQSAVLEQAGRPGLVALDTMAHWIRDRRPELTGILPRVDLLFVDAGEARLLGGSSDEAEAVAAIRRLGVPWVVVKRGSRGARAWGPGPGSETAGPVADVPAVEGVRVVDPTGAGDAFAGGVVGTLARSGGRTGLEAGAVSRALEAGARMGARAVASFSYAALMEEEGT